MGFHQKLYRFIKSSKGFSLVELIVVIGVLGIISTAAVMLINPQQQFKKANDGVRKTDLIKIQGALELYRGDNNYYPPTLLLLTQNSPKYIQAQPVDPTTGLDYSSNYEAQPTGCDNVSTYCAGYLLWACLELNDVKADVNRSPTLTEQCTNPLKSYSVTNP